MEHKLILFIDSGDTLINEATEIRNAKGVVIQAELIKPVSHERYTAADSAN